MNEHFDVLIAGGLVVTGSGLARADVAVSGEQVVAVASDLPREAAARVINAQGLYVLPGAIDVHTHPVYLDDLGGTSISAAYGGVTTMLHYGYAKPGQELLPTLARFRDDGLANSVLDFGLHAGLFDVANQLADVPAAFKMGVTSFKVFMAYAKLKWMTDDYWMTALMDLVAGERGLVAIHAENGLATDYLEDKFLREGRSPIASFAAMRPDILEAEAINRAIALAHLTGCALYVVHNSAAACLEPIRRARANGWPVYGETCPQYLTLTEETTLALKAQAKIGPPLRTAADNAALWAGLADGTLQTVGSDHAPKGKNVDDDFFSAAYGSPQIETMLPVVYDGGINGGKITLTRLVQVMSENPARIFGLYPRKGTIAPGSDADIVLFDPTSVHQLGVAGQHSHANYTLYEGRQVTGALVLVMQRGEVIVEGGELVAAAGRARFLRTDTSCAYN